LPAVFLYDFSVETGQFEIMKQSIATITPDRRCSCSCGFCFGAFIEGAAGFGAPVAIAARSCRPRLSPSTAALNLDLRTPSVGWGAIRQPGTLWRRHARPESDLNAMIGPHPAITAIFGTVVAGARDGQLVGNFRSATGDSCRWPLLRRMLIFWSNYGQQPGGHRRRRHFHGCPIIFLRCWKPNASGDSRMNEKLI